MWHFDSSCRDLCAPRQCSRSLKCGSRSMDFPHTMTKLCAHCCSHEQYSYVRIYIKKANNVMLLVFWLYNMKNTLMCSSHLFGFVTTSDADCGVGDLNPYVDHPEIPFRPLYTNSPSILGDFVNIFHRDSGRKNCLKWQRDCWSLGSGCAKHKTAWPRCIEFLLF